MGMYKSNLSPEQEKARSNTESVEAFLARGGQIQVVSENKKKTKKINAQKLIDAAIASGNSQTIKETIQFLKSQGIEVQ